MELFFAPMSASLVARVVAAEAGIALTFRQVELYTKRLTESGSSYFDEAPLGLLPLLRLDDGTSLTEVAAIVQYLADRSPHTQLAPAWGTPARYELCEWLSFVGAELHKKVLWTIFNRDTPRESKQFARGAAGAVFDHLERRLRERAFLVGETFTVADAHAGWALGLCPYAKLELGDRPALCAYAERVAARPSISAAFQLELPLAMAALARQRPTPA